MADVQSVTKDALAKVSKAAPDSGALTKPTGLAVAGAALAALPLAAQGIAKLTGSGSSSGMADKLKDKAKSQLKETAKEATPDMPKGLGKLFGGGDDSDGENEGGAGKGSAAPGTGSGRRMPIQQAVDVAVPV